MIDGGKVHNSAVAISMLRAKGYDNDAIRRYAAAERSWVPRDSIAGKMWKEVEETVTPAPVQGKTEGKK